MDEKSQAPAGWMVTFADLVTLMFAFFVLLFSMSSIDNKKLREMFGSFSKEGLVPVVARDQSPGGPRGGGSDRGATDEILYSKEKLEELVQEDPSLAELRGILDDLPSVRVRARDNMLVVGLPGQFLFDIGSAELGSQGTWVLSRVLPHLPAGALQVEGHCDPEGEGGADPWALSVDRALAVAEWLVRVGGRPEADLSVWGYGATRPELPAVLEYHRVRNRRVEIVLSRPHAREDHSRLFRRSYRAFLGRGLALPTH